MNRMADRRLKARFNSFALEFKDSSQVLHTNTVDQLLEGLKEIRDEYATEEGLMNVFGSSLEKLVSELYVAFNKLAKGSMQVTLKSVPRIVFEALSEVSVKEDKDTHASTNQSRVEPPAPVSQSLVEPPAPVSQSRVEPPAPVSQSLVEPPAPVSQSLVETPPAPVSPRASLMMSRSFPRVRVSNRKLRKPARFSDQGADPDYIPDVGVQVPKKIAENTAKKSRAHSKTLTVIIEPQAVKSKKLRRSRKIEILTGSVDATTDESMAAVSQSSDVTNQSSDQPTDVKVDPQASVLTDDGVAGTVMTDAFESQDDSGSDGGTEDEEDGNVKDLACDVCSKAFTRQRNLRRHIRLRHPDSYDTSQSDKIIANLWYCSECSEYFHKLEFVREHVESKHAHEDVAHTLSPEKKASHEDSAIMDGEGSEHQSKNGTDLPNCIQVVATPTKLCEICQKDFFQYMGLKQHVLRMHIGIRKRRHAVAHCYVCNEDFYYGDAFRNHYKAEHFDIFLHNSEQPEDAPVICHFCGKTLDNKDKLRKHLVFVHNSTDALTPYNCPVCEATFLSRHRLEEQLRTQHQVDGVYQCNVCQAAFDGPELLAEHIKPCREASTKCLTCGDVFESRDLLDEHTKTHKDDRPFMCMMCGATFRRRTNLRAHEVVVHETDVPIRCEYCNKAFATNSALKKHITRHHSDRRNFVCEHCGRAYTEKRYLEEHLVTHHEMKTKHQCEYCQKYFCVRARMLKHILDVHISKPYIPCEVCGKLFKCQASVRQHMNSHTREKACYCAECDMKFMWMSSYRAHIEKHHNDGSLRFKCTHCSEEFGTRRQLQYHKLHICEYGPKRTYPCRLCHIVCSHRSTLAKHMKRKHSALSHRQKTTRVSAGTKPTVRTIRRSVDEISKWTTQHADSDSLAVADQHSDVLPAHFEAQHMDYFDMEQVENVIEIPHQSVVETVIYTTQQ